MKFKKKIKLLELEVDWWLPGPRGVRKMEDFIQGTNYQSYKMSKFRRSIMYSMVNIVNTAA